MVGDLAERVIQSFQHRYPGRILESVNGGMDGIVDAVANLLASVPVVVVALAFGLVAWRGRYLRQGAVAIIAVHIAWYLGPSPELFDTVALAAVVSAAAWAGLTIFEFGWANLDRRAEVQGGLLRRVTPGRVEQSWLPVDLATYLAVVLALGFLAIQGAGPPAVPAAALIGTASLLAATDRRHAPSDLLQGPRVGEALLVGLLIAVVLGAGLGGGLGGLLAASVATGQIGLAVEVTLSALALGVAASALTGRRGFRSSSSAKLTGDGDRPVERASGSMDERASAPGPSVFQ